MIGKRTKERKGHVRHQEEGKAKGRKDKEQDPRDTKLTERRVDEGGARELGAREMRERGA